MQSWGPSEDQEEPGHQFLELNGTCQQVLLVQPSSTSSEQVFFHKLRETSFCYNQARAIEDYIESSLILEENRR